MANPGSLRLGSLNVDSLRNAEGLAAAVCPTDSIGPILKCAGQVNRRLYRILREIDLANAGVFFGLRQVGLHGPFDALALQEAPAPRNDRVTEFARRLWPRAVMSLRRRFVYQIFMSASKFS
jgi:hypothetical protein